MQTISKLMMLQLAVNDMPKAKELYEEKLGLKVVADYRQADDRWWVTLVLPEGGVNITLTTHHAHMKPGAQTLYFGTSDVKASHEELGGKGIEVSEIQDDLHGPGSGTKWFSFKDVDGNLIHVEQA